MKKHIWNNEISHSSTRTTKIIPLRHDNGVTRLLQYNKENSQYYTYSHARINTYTISPTFALGYESFAFETLSKLASTLHSPDKMDNIQNTLAISAPGNDTIKLALSCFMLERSNQTQSNDVELSLVQIIWWWYNFFVNA